MHDTIAVLSVGVLCLLKLMYREPTDIQQSHYEKTNSI